MIPCGLCSSLCSVYVVYNALKFPMVLLLSLDPEFMDLTCDDFLTRLPTDAEPKPSAGSNRFKPYGNDIK